MKLILLSYFALTLLVASTTVSCKSKAPVAVAPLPDYTTSMRQTQKDMENAFVYEHDLFIKLYDRSLRKDEIPYPQLHILIDSIQDFRNMHGALLEYIENENETLQSDGLSDEAKKNVQQRIENVMIDANRVALRYTTIMQQIGNLKMLYSIKEVHSLDWLTEKRLQLSSLQKRLDKQAEYLKDEALRLGVNNLEENPNVQSTPEIDRLQELMGAHAFCQQYFLKMMETMNKAEAQLTGTTWYEGPFIQKPSILSELDSALAQTGQIMNEFDFLAK